MPHPQGRLPDGRCSTRGHLPTRSRSSAAPRHPEAVPGGSHEDVPIVAVVAPEQEEKYADVLRGVQVWTHPPTIADLDGFAAQTEAVNDLHAEAS